MITDNQILPRIEEAKNFIRYLYHICLADMQALLVQVLAVFHTAYPRFARTLGTLGSLSRIPEPLYNTHFYDIFATCMYCKRGLFHLRKEIKSNEATDKQYSFIFKT